MQDRLRVQRAFPGLRERPAYAGSTGSNLSGFLHNANFCIRHQVPRPPGQSFPTI